MTKAIHRADERSKPGEVTVTETLRAEHFAQRLLPSAIHIQFERIERASPA